MPEVVRRKTVTAMVGKVRVGSDAPVVVQSMTNTDTADIPGSIEQIASLVQAGSELVRVTVNNDDAAQAVPYIVEGLAKRGLDVPIVGDFHYNGHLLLTKYPACAQALAKYRINPGNVSIGRKNDDNFRAMIEVAVENQKPVRIGVNWGSLDQALLTAMMDENSRRAEPLDARDVMMEAMLTSALSSAEAAERYGLRHDQIILSAKVSGVRDLLDVYTMLATRCDYPLHLGLTEAGMGMKGIVASAAGLAPLLLAGIGDTIRVSLTPKPGGDRAEEVLTAQQILQSLSLRSFTPQVTACPRLRAHHEHILPASRGADSGLPAGLHADVARAVSGCGGDEAGGDGLHRERPRGEQACEYRHLAARHGRGAEGAGVCRRATGDDAARRYHRLRFPEDSG